jgi:anti-anti-sigma factor
MDLGLLPQYFEGIPARGALAACMQMLNDRKPLHAEADVENLKGGTSMNSVFNCSHGPVAGEMFELEGIQELVRGNEAHLLERFLPIVRAQSVTVDLHGVKRIDAAGLAALIQLYCAARDAGHDFTVVNPSSHVAEILVIVGLDRLLASRNADGFFHLGACPQESAA